MEAQPFKQPKRQRVADEAITRLVDRWRRHDTGRTIGRPACDVWHGLYAEAGFDLDAPLTITAALVGTLFLGKPESSREASDAGRNALRTLDREGLLRVISRTGGTWNVTLRDPHVALRARGIVRPDPQRTFNTFDDGEPGATGHDSADDSSDADRGVVSFRRHEPPPDAEGEIARKKGEKSHVFSHPVDPRNLRDKPDSRLSSGSSVLPARPSAAEDLRQRENTRKNSPGPAAIGETLGGVFAAIADPVQAAERRHRIVTDTIRFVRQRLDDPRLREMPCVRWGQAIADGRIGHDVLSAILIRLHNLRERGELRCAPWVYFVSASKRAFRERGLDWPEPFARRS